MHEAAHFARRKENAVGHALDAKEAVAGAMRADGSFDDVTWVNCKSVRRARSADPSAP
jgi:hypothetical protein